MAETEKKYDVFISFARNDKCIADRIETELQKKKINYFDFRKEDRSGLWSLDKCLNAIEESKVFLGIFTNNYLSSKMCIEEARKARNDSVFEKIVFLMYRFDDSDRNLLPNTMKNLDIPDKNYRKIRDILDVSEKISKELEFSCTMPSYDKDLNWKNELSKVKKSIFVGGASLEYPIFIEFIESFGKVIGAIIKKGDVLISTLLLEISEKKYLYFTLPSKDKPIDEDFILKVENKALLLEEDCHLIVSNKGPETDLRKIGFIQKSNYIFVKKSSNCHIVFSYIPVITWNKEALWEQTMNEVVNLNQSI